MITHHFLKNLVRLQEFQCGNWMGVEIISVFGNNIATGIFFTYSIPLLD